MLDSMDRAWGFQVELGGQLADLRQRLPLAVMQAVTREDLLHRTLAGEPLSLGRDRGGNVRRHKVLSKKLSFAPMCFA